MKKRIRVTREDIAKGKPMVADRCPVARALRRQTKWVWRVFSRVAVRLGRSEEIFEILLPPEVGKFVDRFDNGKPVEPFIFSVDFPGQERRK